MAYETYTPMYSEIFTKIHNAKDKATKIKVLQKPKLITIKKLFLKFQMINGFINILKLIYIFTD